MPSSSLYQASVVRSLFDEMAGTYGVVNLIASFGFAARWRHEVVKGLPVDAGASVVDLMSGMGDLCRSVARHLPTPRQVTGVDISPEMIRRTRTAWPFQVELKLADVLESDFAPGSADVIVSSFGLKTFSPEQQAMLAEKVALLLRPGGVFSFVEISVPKKWALTRLYLFYLDHVIPWIGRIFLGNPANYALLSVYTRAFGDCRHFAECLRRQQLVVEEREHFFGCASSVRGVKPAVSGAAGQAARRNCFDRAEP